MALRTRMRKLRHLLRIEDLSPAEFLTILDRARYLKQKKKEGIPHPYLPGQVLALIFEKPSQRTRVSFEVGMYQLGGTSLYLNASDILFKHREPVSDMARVLSRYVDAVVLRTFSHADIEAFAQFSTIPVINGLSDTHHPCQALADLLTMEEKLGSLSGRKIAYVGDVNNVCQSLITAANYAGIQIVVSCPDAYRTLSEEGFVYESDPKKAVMDADVIYTDVWTSMGQESEADLRRRAFAPYQVNEGLMSSSKPSAIFLHCLPAHEGEEVTRSVLESQQSVVFDQAENRLHAQKALLTFLAGVDFS